MLKIFFVREKTKVPLWSCAIVVFYGFLFQEKKVMPHGAIRVGRFIQRRRNEEREGRVGVITGWVDSTQAL